MLAQDRKFDSLNFQRIQFSMICLNLVTTVGFLKVSIIQKIFNIESFITLSWHRLAISIDGSNVKLYNNGQMVEDVKQLYRSSKPLSTEGILLVASQFSPSAFSDNTDIYFEVRYFSFFQFIKLLSNYFNYI